MKHNKRLERDAAKSAPRPSSLALYSDKEKMMEQYWGPLQSFVIGILLIVFREKIATWIQKVFEKFPKYEDGVKSLNMKFSVKPVFIAILGAMYTLMAILGIVEIATG